jgi:hypothetical protein
MEKPVGHLRCIIPFFALGNKQNKGIPVASTIDFRYTCRVAACSAREEVENCFCSVFRKFICCFKYF